MILICRTYDECTPESAEDGESSDAGFVYEDEPMTFRELVRELRDMSEASNGRPTGDIGEWYSTGYSVTDYSNLTERNESVHYSHNNPARNAKYWRWAARAAGLVRGAA